MTAEGASLKPTSVIRLTADRELHSNGGNGGNGDGHADDLAWFTAMGEEWNCDRALVPALHLLRGHKGTSLQTMLDAVPPPARSALRLQLTVMASAGRSRSVMVDAPPMADAASRLLQPS